MDLDKGSKASRHSVTPYFNSVGNEDIPSVGIRTPPGPYYPVNVINNIFPGGEHMPLEMPQPEDFRVAHPEEKEEEEEENEEEQQVNEEDFKESITPKSYHHSDLEDSPKWGKGSHIIHRQRIASLTPGSPGGAQPVGPISYEKKLPWPTDLESAYMPIGPDIALLDDYYLPNERPPFLGLDRSYEEDLFSPTEPEQAENPFASQPSPGPLLVEKKQVYVPYRPCMPLSPQHESERPDSVSSFGSPYYGYNAFAFDKRALDEGVLTPISNYSVTPKDDSNYQPVLRKPVPKSSGSISRPGTRHQSFTSAITSVMGSESGIPPMPIRDLYSPPATPPIPSPAPPPVPPKHNISPVETQITLCDVSKPEPEIRMTATVGPGNNSWPTIPTDNPYIDMTSSRAAKIQVPDVVRNIVPKRKSWWKRLFSRSRSR